MRKTILKGKKAQNDVSIYAGIFIFFFLLGIILPIIAAAFDTPTTTYSVDAVTGVKTEIEDAGSLSIWRVLFSVLTVFFWSFDVNVWINLFLLEPIRVIAYVIIARNIWVGGGG